ncbi:hypothetical protein D3C72_1397110 [compost metagenome]
MIINLIVEICCTFGDIIKKFGEAAVVDFILCIAKCDTLRVCGCFEIIYIILCDIFGLFTYFTYHSVYVAFERIVGKLAHLSFF